MIDKNAPGAYLLKGKWVIDGISDIEIEPNFEEIDEDGDWTVELICVEFNSRQPSMECRQMMGYLWRDSMRHLHAWTLCAKRCQANEDIIYWHNRNFAPMDLVYLDNYIDFNIVVDEMCKFLEI